MVSKQSTLSTLALVAFVVLTSIIAIDNSQIANFFKKSDFKTGTANGLTIIQMYPNGTRRYIATIASATQYSNSNITFNTLHVLTYPQNNSPVWHISSDQGLVSDNRTRIDLWGHVKATRAAKGQYRPLLLTTTRITLYPNKHFATTQARVNLTQPGTKNMITGVGMDAYSKPKEIVHLLSDVQSTYEPQNYHPAPAQ